MLGVSGDFNGIFAQNSKTKFRDVFDGTSNTMSIGERSSDIFDSTWVGVSSGTTNAGWRVLGWTGEVFNNETVPFHPHAQFNSVHGQLANFAFCDGSIKLLKESIDPVTFESFGSINGAEIISDY